MPSCQLDHLVIVAASLEQGVQYCADMLGVSPAGGGEHMRMGTHNRLLYLGPGLYLEVIAINPAASESDGARWFGMDDPAQRQRVAKSPALMTFAVRTNDIGTACRQLPQLGTFDTMQRGSLQWQITLTPDGALQEGGCLPTVIQWPQDVHPANAMTDSGCRLVSLEVHHPVPARLEAQWRQIGLEQDERLKLCAAGQGEAPRLVARIATPDGLKTIG